MLTIRTGSMDNDFNCCDILSNLIELEFIKLLCSNFDNVTQINKYLKTRSKIIARQNLLFFKPFI